jgi:hemerythrin-like domain-containing protein
MSGVAPRRSRVSAAPHTEEDRVPSLTDTSHEHHGVINEHLDRLPVIADSIGRVDVAALRDAFMPEYAFITGRLIRHMTAIEASLYTPLEKLMEGRHSMAPMRREHEELVRLVDSLGDFAAKLEDGTLDPDDGIGLRRALYRLHSIVKVHLAEEELYLGVLDHNLSEEEKDEITRALVHACEQPL